MHAYASVCIYIYMCAMKHGSASGCHWLRIISKRVYCIWLWRFIFAHTHTNRIMSEIYTYTNTFKNPFTHYSHPMFYRKCKPTIFSMCMRKWCAQIVVRVEREHIIISIKKRNLAHLEQGKEFFLCAIHIYVYIYGRNNK